MATNQDRLDEGPPAIDTTIPAADLPTVDSTNYGTAFSALLGVKTTAENQLGTALLRAPVLVLGLTVVANTVTMSTSGVVTAVRGRTGAATGAKLPLPSGTAAAGEVVITYDAQFIPTLTFDVGDAITAAEVTQMQIPAAFITQLQTTNPP